jgi:hypothetical protein
MSTSAFVRTAGITRGLLQDLEETAAGLALAALRRTLAVHERDQGGCSTPALGSSGAAPVSAPWRGSHRPRRTP